jgi:hypothetical protein
MAGGALTLSLGDSMPPMTDSASLGLHGGDVPIGAFLGKSIPEAAQLCLQIVKRKLTSREIAEYLKKGGIESSSKNFPLQVHSILSRAVKSSSTTKLLKLDRSYWGLVDWYPAGMRSSSPATEKRANGKKRGPKPKNQKSKTAKPKTTEGTQDRILQELNSHPGTEFVPAELAKSLGMRVQTVHFLLGKLAFKKQAERTQDGKYRVAAA